MPDYIGDALSPKVIRVTKGADRLITFHRKDTDGNPVDWDAGIYILIDISRVSATRVDAVVNGPDASLRLESTVCDLVKNDTTWRLILTEADSPTLETALAVGTFKRQDGGR